MQGEIIAWIHLTKIYIVVELTEEEIRIAFQVVARGWGGMKSCCSVDIEFQSCKLKKF